MIVLLAVPAKSLAYVVSSPWKTVITKPPRPGLSWICMYGGQIVFRVDKPGLVLLKLHGQYTPLAVLGPDLEPLPYYVDYVNSNYVRVWVNVSKPGLIHVLVNGIVTWSNGFLTFSHTVDNYIVPLFTDFRSLDGWIAGTGMVTMLGWNSTLQSYGIRLSPGTTILSLLYTFQRQVLDNNYAVHVWERTDNCIGIILSTSLSPTYTPTITYCGVGLHLLTIISNSTGLYLYVNGVFKEKKPPLHGELYWIGFRAYNTSVTIYKLYFTPARYSVLSNKDIVAVSRPCTWVRVLAVNPGGEVVKIPCTLSDGVLTTRYVTGGNATVVAYSELHVSCTVNGVVVLNRTIGLVTEPATYRYTIYMYMYRDYLNKDRVYACSNSCIVRCYRNCGIAIINADRGTLVAVNYSKKPTRLEVQGAEHVWRNNNILVLQAEKNRTTIIDEYMLCIFMRDTLGRPILLPGTYTYIDGQRYPTPLCMFYPAGKTNITVPSNIDGFKLKELNDTNSSSIVFILDRDAKVYAIYRVATRINYRYYLTSAGDKTVNITFTGKLTDFYGVPIGHATIVATCNDTTASAVTRGDGSFTITLTLPKGRVYTCTLRYPGNETFAGTMIQVIIQRTPPIQLTAIIALAVAIVGVVLYVLLKRKKSKQG